MRSPIVRCAGALCSLARSSQNGLRQALCVPRNSGRPQHCGSHSRQITSNSTRAMYEMKIAAGARSEHAAATPGVDTSKDTQKTLAFHQQRVYNLLQSGKKYSAADISVALRLSDPRSCIRDLGPKASTSSMNGCPASTVLVSKGIIWKEVRND